MKAFQLRAHALGAEHGWEMVGPDGEVWCRGDAATRNRIVGLLAVVTMSIQTAGAAVEWADSIAGKGQNDDSISRIA